MGMTMATIKLVDDGNNQRCVALDKGNAAAPAAAAHQQQNLADSADPGSAAAATAAATVAPAATTAAAAPPPAPDSGAAAAADSEATAAAEAAAAADEPHLDEPSDEPQDGLPEQSVGPSVSETGSFASSFAGAAEIQRLQRQLEELGRVVHGGRGGGRPAPRTIRPPPARPPPSMAEVRRLLLLAQNANIKASASANHDTLLCLQKCELVDKHLRATFKVLAALDEQAP